MANDWTKLAILADRFALPVWIILIVYGLYEISRGNLLALVVLVIGLGGLIIDGTFTIENRKIK